MLWDKKLSSRNTLKIVRFHRSPERDLIAGLCAEDHDIVKVTTVFFDFILRRWLILSKDTARREDVGYGVNHDAERWKRKVAGVVLNPVSCFESRALSDDLQ